MSRGVSGYRRNSPTVRRLAIAALVVLTFFAAYRVWDHVELRRLIREIETIRASGEPVTRRAAVERTVSPNAEPGDAGRYYLAASVLAPHFGTLPLSDARTLAPWILGATDIAPSLAEIRDTLRRTTEEAGDVLALVDTGATLPLRELPAAAPSASAQSVMQAALVIWLRTLNLSLAGDGDGAVESALSGLQFRRALHGGGSPILTLGDHETAIILSLTTPSDAQLLRLQQALELEERQDRLLDGLLEARASYIEQLWRSSYGSDPTAPHLILPRGRSASTPPRAWLSRRMTHTLKVWSDVIEAARTPWPEKLQAADTVRRRHESDVRAGAGPDWLSDPAALPVIVWFGPAIALEQLRYGTRVHPLGGPGQLIIDRSSRVAIAIERYRRDHAGALPDTLEALVPRYLQTVPADPLTGSPLLYRADDESYTVYSVGENLADDGGLLLQPSPPGARTPFTAGPDIGIRVLLRP